MAYYGAHLRWTIVSLSILGHTACGDDNTGGNDAAETGGGETGDTSRGSADSGSPTSAGSGSAGGSDSTSAEASDTNADSGSDTGRISCPDVCIELCEGGQCSCDCGPTVGSCADCPSTTLCVKHTVDAGTPNGNPDVWFSCGTIPRTCGDEVTCDCATVCFDYETCKMCDEGICCDSAAA